MSWDNTYTHNVLIGLDQFGAAVLFNRNDLTISTICDMVMKGDYDRPLKPWQKDFCLWLGPKLNKLQANHCAESRQGDEDRAVATLTALGKKVTATG